MSEAILRCRVNGSILANFNGKPVCVIGTVVNTHPNGTSVEIKTPDEHIVTVNMRQPIMEPLTDLVEFRGTGQGKSAIICDDYTIFPATFSESFDAEHYNKALMFINSVPNPWVAETQNN